MDHIATIPAPAARAHEFAGPQATLLQLLWGEGFLSPGGPGKIAAILAGLDLENRLVLDLGCGAGGVDVLLARDHGAEVIGLDIEPPLVESARERIAAAGLSDRVEFHCVAPGPLPLDDELVEVAFGKDAWVHIGDKPALFAELHRVLRPGGVLAAGDWMLGEGRYPYSEAMLYFFRMEGDITYHIDTFSNYEKAMRDAGFVDIEITDVAEAYRVEAHDEYERMQCAPLRDGMIEALGAKQHAYYVENWRAITVVLDEGDLRPGHLRARKPG